MNFIPVYNLHMDPAHIYNGFKSVDVVAQPREGDFGIDVNVGSEI